MLHCFCLVPSWDAWAHTVSPTSVGSTTVSGAWIHRHTHVPMSPICMVPQSCPFQGPEPAQVGVLGACDCCEGRNVWPLGGFMFSNEQFKKLMVKRALHNLPAVLALCCSPIYASGPFWASGGLTQHSLTSGGVGNAIVVFDFPSLQELIEGLQNISQAVIHFISLGTPSTEKACNRCRMMCAAFSPVWAGA